MSKKNDNRVFAKIFTLIKDIINMFPQKSNIIICIEVITIDGVKNQIKITKNNKDLIETNKNIIIVNKQVLCLDDIVKIKILDTNLNNEAKNIFMKDIENIIAKEITQEYKNTGTYRSNNNLSKEKNIEWYIEENKKNINTIYCDGINCDAYINNIKAIDKDKALNCSTSLDIKRKAVLEGVEVNTEKDSVISSIDEDKEKVIKDINIEEKLVLTNNCNEVKVAKPIKTEQIDVVTDVHIEGGQLITNQSTTKVVKDIKENKLKAIVDENTIYEEKLIGNINKDMQLIQPKSVDILFIEPSNKNVNKEEIKDRYLTFDPTGENYIGVVLDDGTFEPLKVSMETITVVPNNVKNILINIDENKNIINKVVKDIEYSKANFTGFLDIEYNDNVLEKTEEDKTQINNIITTSNRTINNIVNEDETAIVVTKDNMQSIKSIKNIEYDSVSKINNIEKIDVVSSAKTIENKKYVMEDAKLYKESTNLISNIEIVKESIPIPLKENIDGVIKLVGGGVMIVENNDSCITIYNTSKISKII
ncbi:MAG: hypothetical protein E6356_06685 [Terrisporobacter othiniensis]|nr:hypothetical protein [Terrisporobacter othiniensis]MDU6994521.1 hypothetical protein [Terrisporobacter othiniensis]